VAIYRPIFQPRCSTILALVTGLDRLRFFFSFDLSYLGVASQRPGLSRLGGKAVSKPKNLLKSGYPLVHNGPMSIAHIMAASPWNGHRWPVKWRYIPLTA
jgi:hypothetical protein